MTATLTPVAEGILHYGRHSYEVVTDKAVVFVHPFFAKKDLKMRKEWQQRSHNWDPRLEQDIKQHENYLAQIRSVVERAQNPVITFEEESRLEKTLLRYRRYAGEQRDDVDWYFIPTKQADPTPAHPASWISAIRLVRDLNLTTVLMGGGILGNYPGPVDRYTGCLGETIQQFANAKLPYQVIPKLTFS